MDSQVSLAPVGDQEDIDNVEISDYEDMVDEDVAPVPVSSRFAARPTTAEEVLNRIEALLLQSKIDARESRQDKEKDRRHGKNKEAEEDATLLRDELAEGAVTGHIGQPAIFRGEMRDYQQEALNWMVNQHDNGLNGILADEMGLGKTCETISLLTYLRESRGTKGKHLIIVPKSTITNWQREITRFCPDFTVLMLGGSKADREEQKQKISESDIIITTYEVVIIERAVLRFVRFEYLIIDEAHRIKNETSKLSQVVRQQKSKHRLLITGTPLQNNLHELWALLNFLKPNIFKASQDFHLLFQAPVIAEDGKTEDERNAAAQDVIIKRLHRILRPFLLRRLKTDVATALPPKIETKLFVGLSALQREWYTHLLARDVDALNSSASSNTKTQLLNIMMQLRKVCNHVYLFDGAEPEPFVDGEHLIENSGKMVLQDKLLTKQKKDGSRVLIFSQMTRMLDILEDYCRYREYKYCRIDGSTSQDVRDDSMDRFNAPNSEQFIFLLSTRAGGLGINLQTADTVILYDSDWNPQMDLQAMDRAHRIGQKKQVKVFRFVTEGTVEEKIIERATRKLALDALVVQKGRLLEKEKNVSAQELQNMVRFGAAYIFSAQGSTITDEDIDMILQKGNERTKTESEKLQTAKLSLSNFSLTDLDATFNANEFDGVDYSNAKTKLEVPVFASSAQNNRRERKMEGSYDVNKYYKQAIYGTTAERKAVMREFKPTPRFDFQFLQESRIVEIEKLIFDADTRYRHLKYEKRWADLAKRNMRAHEKILERKKLIKLMGLNSKEGAERALAFAAQQEDEMKIEMDGDEESVSNPSSVVDEEEEEIDDETLRAQAEFPSDELYAELETQLNEGYPQWKRTDLQRFISVSAEFGRNNLDSIKHAVEGKSPSEVEQYHSAFWAGYKHVKDSDKMIKNIEKGEAHLNRLETIGIQLSAKLATVRDPYLNLPVTCPAKASQGYTETEDRFLLCAMAYHGYGNWEQIKKDVMFNPFFRCNLYMKTRAVTDIRFRCEALVRMLEKERDAGLLIVKKESDGKRKSEEDAEVKTKKKKGIKTEDGK